MTTHDNPDARYLASLGFALCEVAHPNSDGTCSCRLRGDCPSAGKHALGARWMQRAVDAHDRRPEFVPGWARLAPVTSYGVIPPKGSGLFVIDRDDPAVLLPLIDTFEVRRSSAPPGRGHFYYRLPDGIAEDDVPRAFAGGEVRVAQSGHVVGPACRHKSGDIYESNGAAVAYADRDLIEALRALKPVRKGPDGAVGPVEGSRHAFLVGAARKYAGWGWNAERIADGIRELNETVVDPPLSEAAMEPERMAKWAVANIRPDGPSVRIKAKGALRAQRGWPS